MDIIVSYFQWLASFDSFLLAGLLMLLSAIALIVLVAMGVLVVAAVFFFVIKVAFFTPLGWILIAFAVWFFHFQTDERPGYGVDSSFVSSCSRVPSCIDALHARDKVPASKLDAVQPTGRLQPVTE